VRAVVAMSAANGLAQHAREVMKTCCEVAKRVRLAREPDGYAATLSRHGEEDLVTNPPTGWDERQRQKGTEAADLLVSHSAGDTGQR
jgi:hypothetical protein